jgi:hypothetical protein
LLDHIPFPLGTRITVIATDWYRPDFSLAGSVLFSMFDVRRPFGVHIRHKSVSDLVSKTRGTCILDGKVGELLVTGHGNGTGQFFGSNYLDHITLEGHLPTLKKIQFAPNAMLSLGGCLMGRAYQLLNALSKNLNVIARGWTGVQRPAAPGQQGAEVVSEGGRIVSVSVRGLLDPLDDCQLKLLGIDEVPPIPVVGM